MSDFYLLVFALSVAIAILSLILGFKIYCRRNRKNKKKEDDDFVDMNLSATLVSKPPLSKKRLVSDD